MVGVLHTSAKPELIGIDRWNELLDQPRYFGSEDGRLMLSNF